MKANSRYYASAGTGFDPEVNDWREERRFFANSNNRKVVLEILRDEGGEDIAWRIEQHSDGDDGARRTISSCLSDACNQEQLSEGLNRAIAEAASMLGFNKELLETSLFCPDELYDCDAVKADNVHFFPQALGATADFSEDEDAAGRIDANVRDVWIVFTRFDVIESGVDVELEDDGAAWWASEFDDGDPDETDDEHGMWVVVPE